VRVRVGAHSIRVSVSGTEGRALMLVNGLGAPLETWGTFRDALGARRTIAVDAPGTGGSSTPMRPLTVRELALVTLEVAEALDARDLDVLGYSFGGAITQEMARLAPGRVHRLVLAATNYGWGSPFGNPLAAVSAMTACASFSPRPDPLGYWWQIAAIATWSSFPWIARVRQPTLVLAGEHDRVVPLSACRMLALRLPNAQLGVVEGAEHWFLIADGARDAASRVVEFLARDQLPDGSLVCT
jgi:pimeloyl-ACP methyl ester carboxylesterase